MRVLILSHLYADPSQRQKLRELAGLGWSVIVAVPGGRVEADGPLRIVPIPISGSPAAPERLRWSGRGLRHLLTDTRPDLVHVEEEPGTHGALVATREAARLRIPSVVFSWESRPGKRAYLERRRRDRTLGGVSGLIGGNHLATALLVSAAPGVPALSLPQTGVTPPTNPERRAHPGLAIAAVGRLVPERGVDRLLRACGQLMGPWTLTIAGTGPEQEALEDLSQRLGLASRIQWLGPLSRQEVAALWPDVDCLVVPSRSTAEWVEQSSPALLDAMAHGVAGIVSSDGTLPELVGDAGIVVSTDEELLVALQQLIATPERSRILGEAARRRVLDQYVDAALARATDAFWREVLERLKG